MSAYSILPTRSPAKYRGKYPARARSVSCGATGVHVELNNGLRLWSYGGKLRELPRVGDDFAAELNAAPAMTAEHYAKLCEAAELSRKAPEGETNAARTIARAEKAAAIRDLLDSILAPVPAESLPPAFDPSLSNDAQAATMAGWEIATPIGNAEAAPVDESPLVQCVRVENLPGGLFSVTAEVGPGEVPDAARIESSYPEAERAARAMAARYGVDVYDSTAEANRESRARLTVRANRLAQAEGMAAIAKAEQQAANADTLRVIDMTPTWAGILPTLRALIENGNPEGRRTAWAELEKMARLADERNRMAESFAELRGLLSDWPTFRALSAYGAERATAKKAAALEIVARHIPETISNKESGE